MKYNFYNSAPLAYIISFMFLLLGLNSQAQTKNGTITGTVKTNDGSPAGDVNISLKEINRGTITNESGSFQLKGIKEGSYTLIVSFVGLNTQEKAIQVTAGKTAIIEVTLSENAGKLAEVVVTGARGMNRKPVSAGKIEIAPMDLPQAVTIINSKVIKEQQVNKLSDAIKNINGVTLTDNRGTNVETFFARGYNLGANNIMKNGARANSGIIPEASTLESIEVLKGSAALLYGNVSSGAIINMVTKKPQFEFGGEVSMRTGSYSFYKPTVDVYGPISKNLAVRVISTYEKAESFRNSVKSKRYYVNPSLLYQISPKTDLLIQGDYLNADFTPDFGIGTLNSVIPTSISRSSFFNTPWAFQKAKQATASANLNHQFNANWKLNTVLAYQNFDRNYYSTERIQADAIGDWSRNLTRSKTNENYYTGQLNLNGDLRTGKIRHQLVVGADAERYLNKVNTYTVTNTVTDPMTAKKTTTTYYLDENNKDQVSKSYDKINTLDPNKYVARTDMFTMNPFNLVETPTDRFGIFFQDLISISEKVKVLAGLRWSYQNVIAPKVTDAVTGERLPYANASSVRATTAPTTIIKDKSDKALSPRLGLVYQPLKTTSLFASYSNNFVPNSGTDIYGANLKASLIDQYEVGVKNDFFNGRVSANLTVYKIINNNVAQMAEFKADGITSNSDATVKVLSGKSTSDGVEVDINGTLAKGLNFLAGYSHNFIRYTKTSDETGSFKEGERLVGTPANTANASLFYTFSNWKLNGLKVGFSGFYTGDRNGGWNTSRQSDGTYLYRLIPVSGFTTFDLSLGYTYKKFSILGKVSNLTNELNYFVHENYSVNPIPPRQFTTTLAYKF